MCEPRPEKNIINLMGEDFRKPVIKKKKELIKLIPKAFSGNGKTK